MRSMRYGGRLGAVAIATFVWATAVAGPAAAMSASGWALISTVGATSGRVGSGDIAVSGATNAWSEWTCGPCSSTSSHHSNGIYRWNGHAWVTEAVPSVLQYPAVISGLGTSSASNVWMFVDGGKAAVFNGSHWTTKTLPSWVERPIAGTVSSVATEVFSSTNVWAFSIDAHSDPTLAAHYSSGTWHKVTLPIRPMTVDGVAPTDIWVYGTRSSGAHALALAHWNGHTWSTVPFPADPSGTTTIPGGLVATSASSVWMYGEVFRAGKVSFELLHWNGHTWAKIAVPASIGILESMAYDGRGGLWMVASGDTPGHEGAHFVEYTAAKFEVKTVPADGKVASSPGAVVNVPNTHEMWCVGFLVAPTGTRGEILGYDQ